MRISVVIPCHNAGRWIGETLRSVAGQTLTPHEVIVIDDGSRDDSVEQIRRSGIDIRLFQVNVRNAAAARNVGIEAATGDWIALLDADDVWHPNHLTQATLLLDRGTDEAYMANFDVQDLTGQIGSLPNPHPITKPHTGLSHRDFIPFLASDCLYGHSTVIYRKSTLLAVGLFDPSQCRRHDIDLWLRVLDGRTWAYHSRPAAVYRSETPNSISRHLSECEYYFLRALLRHRDSYGGPEWDRLVRTSARRGMSLAFVDGEETLFSQIREQAWPYLSQKLRMAYRAGGMSPCLLRWAIKAKRAIRRRTLAVGS